MSKFKVIAFLVLGFIVYKVFFAVKDFQVGLDKRIEKVEALGLDQNNEIISLMMYLGEPDDLVLVEHFLVKNRSKCLEMKKNAKEVSNAYYECARINGIVKEGKIITVIEKLEVL